ncbi:MAG: 5-(carboxyamino)imidazole ribonucleotide synthase [Bacteroidetes bacterium]|nr:5-(carboxyamino)imidazole ribonucleotide synthase [Rhodothermia bacterium]MCS7154729.1 5-(carboxyamino)imidazole ribonucleotide synthase [Bacteroidota bacterium]MCX7907114.1 5-(carboxyamino)imidazole ribonucleotide synthase [Bacteroidota bacterium]MDW8137522.1 5-(carboxyamino)imidazole ribonucleotide synthase [Bacteroidota bacterium]MDW8285524.1 5-(carboxyamino)imidazole ribonucleotide synthase [Bacteroidota bacterium]
MSALAPPARIGILGGGQLGRMLALVARRMGYRVLVLDPSPDSPAAQVADRQITAPYEDLEAVRALARACEVVTFEFENVDSEAVRALEAEGIRVHPPAEALWIGQNRLREKTFFRSLGLPTVAFEPIDSPEALGPALERIGFPAVLKSCEGGYDGKGQWVLRDSASVENVLRELDPNRGPWILERWVAFEREISVLLARTAEGRLAVFPVFENTHREGILFETRFPARLPSSVARRAQGYARRLAEGLRYVGLLAVEMFVLPDGAVLLNEMAPRVHNSGHVTWEAAYTSQFEQHLRAICGLPLGDGRARSRGVMRNLIGPFDGAGLEGLEALLRERNVFFHWYGKAEVRRGRKMGHITAIGGSWPELLARLERAWQGLRWR